MTDTANMRLSSRLDELAGSDLYPFHMPGHKRQAVWEREEAGALHTALNAAHKIDITEIDGFDNLHDPEDILREEMDFAAHFYGTRETFFSVNGSTCALLAAISAAVPQGGTILIERGCHISVYHAAFLRNLEIRYIEETGLGEDAAGAAAVVITSPTYEGVVKDVRRFAEAARRIGAVLIVDEAHGAHFSMHPCFPASAISCGADLVVQSTHKTLPALTQTALLHRVTDRVDSRSIRRFLDIYETSSPSYVLMASITQCIHAAAEHGPAFFGLYAERLMALRAKLNAELAHLHLAGSDEEVQSGRYDPGKIVILTGQAGFYTEEDGSRVPMDGPKLYDLLRETWRLQPEMKAPGYVLLMTSVSDTEEGFGRLLSALTEIDRRIVPLPAFEKKPSAADEACSDGTAAFPPCVMRIADAAERPCKWLPSDKAAGRVAADYVIVYPPDSPLVVPGERFTGDVIDRIRALLEKGLSVTGLRRIRFPEEAGCAPEFDLPCIAEHGITL